MKSALVVRRLTWGLGTPCWAWSYQVEGISSYIPTFAKTVWGLPVIYHSANFTRSDGSSFATHRRKVSDQNQAYWQRHAWRQDWNRRFWGYGHRRYYKTSKVNIPFTKALPNHRLTQPIGLKQELSHILWGLVWNMACLPKKLYALWNMSGHY